MKRNPDFEENYYSITAEGIHKNSHFPIRKMKCLCYADRPFYENSNYSDLMATVLTCPIEVSFWWLLCGSKKINGRISVQMKLWKQDNVIFQNLWEPNIRLKEIKI